MVIKRSKSYVRIIVEVESSDFPAFNVCRGKIAENLEKNKPTSVTLLKEFFGYMTSENFEKRRALYELCNQAGRKTIEYFAEKKGYIFNIRKQGQDFNFSSLIEKVMIHYVGDLWTHKESKTPVKNKTIRTLFTALAIHSRLWNNSIKKPLISHYKKAVIAAYITHELGIHVTQQEPDGQFIEKNLFKAAWDSVQKLSESPSFEKYLDPKISTPDSLKVNSRKK